MRILAVLYCSVLVVNPCGLLAEEVPRPGGMFEKTGLVIIDVGERGTFDATQAKYPCVLKVGSEWWMWYNGRTDDGFTGSIGLAVSKDGLQWEKQNRGLPVFEHGTEGTFDATKVDHPAVLQFEGKFHMWYTAGDKQSNYKIGYATSVDGRHWARENDAQPVLGPGKVGQFDDLVVLHPAVVRDDSGKLHMWYNGVGPQKSFRVGHATSRDGITWQRENGGRPVLEPSMVGDIAEEYVYNVFVRYVNGKFQMWYSAWSEKQQALGRSHNSITYAESYDGNVWKKDSTQTLVNGAPGSIDDYACFACSVVLRGNEMWMYYSAGADEGETYRVSLAISRLRKQVGNE